MAAEPFCFHFVIQNIAVEYVTLHYNDGIDDYYRRLSTVHCVNEDNVWSRLSSLAILFYYIKESPLSGLAI